LVIERDDTKLDEREISLQEIDGQVLSTNISADSVCETEALNWKRHVWEGADRSTQIQTDINRVDLVEQSKVV
jgi:hypothetical protein